MFFELIEAVGFAIGIVLPNLLLMAMGFGLRWGDKVSREFIDDASHLVFQYSLPCLLFLSVFNSQVNIMAQLPLIGAGVVVTMMLFVGAEVYARHFIAKPADQGVFVQGVFRSNMAIIALATVHNAYGEMGLSVGAVYMGVITVLFNVLAVIALSRDVAQGQKLPNLIKKIAKNPLIIALVLAFFAKALNFPPLPSVVQSSGELLARIALPLALICAGATINVKAMLSLSGLSMQASLARIFIAPVLAVLVGYGFGLTAQITDMAKIQMGVLFLMVASPTAAASYVMAKAMGGNDVLAANILAFTTIFSMISMAVGAAILRTVGWM